MAIMTYFKFVRWLFFLNIYQSVIMLLVVIIPGSFMLPYHFEKSLSTSNISEFKTSVQCSRQYKSYIGNFTQKLTKVDKILDFLKGTVSIMFYCLCTSYVVFCRLVGCFIVSNVTFNNISVISWSVLLMEETRVPGENHRPSASH
jgi:hypothetical protein